MNTIPLYVCIGYAVRDSLNPVPHLHRAYTGPPIRFRTFIRFVKSFIGSYGVHYVCVTIISVSAFRSVLIFFSNSPFFAIRSEFNLFSMVRLIAKKKGQKRVFFSLPFSVYPSARFTWDRAVIAANAANGGAQRDEPPDVVWIAGPDHHPRTSFYLSEVDHR